MTYQSESEAVVMLASGAFCSRPSIHRLPNSSTRMPMSSRVSSALPARLRSRRLPMTRMPFSRSSRNTRTRRKTRRIFSSQHRQAGQQVGPAELPEEVVRPRRRRDQPVDEVGEQDDGEQGVHRLQHRVEALVLDDVHQHHVEDRQHRDGADEDLVADVLQLVPLLRGPWPARRDGWRLMRLMLAARRGAAGITPRGWTAPARAPRRRSRAGGGPRRRRGPCRSRPTGPRAARAPRRAPHGR